MAEMQSDEELVRAFRQGNTEAFDILMEKYKPLVRKLSTARFLVGADHEDLVQEGMIGLYKAVRDFNPENEKQASFFTFATLCIDRQMIHAIEASQRQKNRPLNDSLSLEADEVEACLLHNQASPEKLMIEQEIRDETLKRIREKLSPMERNVLELFLEGFDYREIAQALGKEPKSIDNALQRMRRKIEQLL